MIKVAVSNEKDLGGFAVRRDLPLVGIKAKGPYARQIGCPMDELELGIYGVYSPQLKVANREDPSEEVIVNPGELFSMGQIMDVPASA